MESFQQQTSMAVDEGPPNDWAGLLLQPEPKAVVPLIELESQAIANALAHTRGDTTLTARLLGIGRTTVYRKVKQYQLREHLRYGRLARSSG
jgi:transcriptional regulator of acetoin/glycerol metabolism